MESGKRKTFVFRLERDSGSDERSNGERLLAGYLLQGGAKACEAGLKRKTSKKSSLRANVMSVVSSHFLIKIQ